MFKTQSSNLEEQPSENTMISLDTLANNPELLLADNSGERAYLKEHKYSQISECKCRPEFDRNYTDYKQWKKNGTVNIPAGFTTPLDLFESVITELIAIKYQNNDAIHIVSIGSGKLLRDLIIIAKLIKKIKENSAIKKEPEIILHAIDFAYEKYPPIITYV